MSSKARDSTHDLVRQVSPFSEGSTHANKHRCGPPTACTREIEGRAQRTFQQM